MIGAIQLVCWSAVGASLGSFCATAGLRLSVGEQALHGRSRCDGCGVSLRYAATLPIVSFLRLGGRCATCGAKINPLHLVGEIVGPIILFSALASVPGLWAVGMASVGFVVLTVAVMAAERLRDPGSPRSANLASPADIRGGHPNG